MKQTTDMINDTHRKYTLENKKIVCGYCQCYVFYKSGKNHKCNSCDKLLKAPECISCQETLKINDKEEYWDTDGCGPYDFKCFESLPDELREVKA